MKVEISGGGRWGFRDCSGKEGLALKSTTYNVDVPAAKPRHVSRFSNVQLSTLRVCQQSTWRDAEIMFSNI